MVDNVILPVIAVITVIGTIVVINLHYGVI